VVEHGNDVTSSQDCFPRSSQAIRHLPFLAYRVLV